ncbi:hypothetical protein BHE74_00010893 [Ensete ventricosum]|nr:hypothetical protein GW17_00009358 [Ensete ventricosum]RWW80750.1 hypothetical protein BHE74_00010893 [Ensete ventricosum]RZS05494.1 hypothetical protein BHM03_00036025 [Ensete ventricosum]
MSSSFRTATASLRRSSAVGSMRYDDDENELIWAAVERLPTFERARTSVFDHWDGGDNGSGEQNKMKAISLEGLDQSLQTDYILKVMFLRTKHNGRGYHEKRHLRR